MARVLIIDDDQMVCEFIATTIEQMEQVAVCANTLEEGFYQLRSKAFDVVMLDVNLPDGNGLALLPQIRNTSSLPEVIIITGDGSFEGAESAILNGAWDYIAKPLQATSLKFTLKCVLQYRTEKERMDAPMQMKREGIIGNSPKLMACLRTAARVVNLHSNVLITGETGTGKELFARAIHDNSERSSKPFVIVDCGALPQSLVESILFGHAKGAFTHAVTAREGLVKQADGGTLFLDEIGELPFEVQRAFLRLLQERSFRPVGDSKEIRSDFRLIAATNRNLPQMIAENKFRKDLFFRLQSVVINLPPLRERQDDLEEIVQVYLTKFCDNFGISVKKVSPEFLAPLKRYPWPGNIRELINVLEHAIPISNEEKTLFPIHLPPQIRLHLAKTAFTSQASGQRCSSPQAGGRDLKAVIERTEKEYFMELVRETQGDIEKICAIAGLSRANVYNRLKKYAIRRSG